MMLRAPILLATSLNEAEEASWLATLSAAMPDEKILLRPEIADPSVVEIAIVANPSPGSLSGLTGLKWVHSLWAGVEKLLADETLPPVPLVRLVDPMLARAMAEAVAAAVLFLHRDFPVYTRQQREANWQPHDIRFAHQRSVTVLGLGEMGHASVGLLAALGFDLRGWSRTERRMQGVRTFHGTEGFQAAIKDADILVNLLPLTSETRGILNSKTFLHLAKGAGLINFGRGAHLVEADMMAALQSGQLSHAVLDVFETEPLPANHPFWARADITILPHISAPTSLKSAAAIVAKAVGEFRATSQLPKGIDRGRGY